MVSLFFEQVQLPWKTARMTVHNEPEYAPRVDAGTMGKNDAMNARCYSYPQISTPAFLAGRRLA